MNTEKNLTNSTGRSAKALKRVQKLCETADVALTMYKFFTYVALLFIQYKLSDMDSQDDRDGGVLPSTFVPYIVDAIPIAFFYIIPV